MRQRFNELPDDVRKTILDKHRDINVSYDDWWYSTEKRFKQDMEDIGIAVDNVYFSGFWSQGDGACFEGKVENWGKFLASLGYSDLTLVNHADEWWGLSVTHSGHYYHQYCTSFNTDLRLPAGVDDEEYAADHFSCEPDSVEAAVQLTLLSQHDTASLEREFIKAFRGHMAELYKRLEREHEHLTSDDAVLDTLEANELLEASINELEGEHA